jgi:hypothetical protein
MGQWSHPPEKTVARTFSTFGVITGLSVEIGFWMGFFWAFPLIDDGYGTLQKTDWQVSVGLEEYAIRTQNQANA